MESFKLSETFPVKAEKLYKAWLDSDIHGKMTGSKAEIDPSVNGKFNAWDGYITGTTVELVPNKKIVQKWRTTEFPENSPDSLLVLTFEETKNVTTLTISHSDIPDGQGDEYKEGWIDYYFGPMKKYFS